MPTNQSEFPALPLRNASQESRRRRIMQALAATVVIACTGSVHAQTTSGKPLTIVAPFAAGSAPDAFTRAVAEDIGKQLGQSVVVDNKPGGSSIVAAQLVAKAPADGQTLLITGNVAFTTNPHTFKQLPYDPEKDFEPITALSKAPLFLYVNARAVAARTAADLIQLARKQPGQISYGYTSPVTRAPGELLQQLTGIQLLGVPYKAGFQALPDLLDGRLNMLFTDLSGMPYVKEGRLAVIAQTDVRRTSVAPDVPTFEESGVKGVDLTFWLAAYAPARTPGPVVQRLYAALVKSTEAPAVQKAMALGGTTAFVNAPGELRKFQAGETAKWGRIIRAAGIQPE